MRLFSIWQLLSSIAHRHNLPDYTGEYNNEESGLIQQKARNHNLATE